MTFVDVVELVGKGVDGAGVANLVVGAPAASTVALRCAVLRQDGVYRQYRQQLGGSILLGLELLVAADIIRTVAVAPTISSISLLAGVVVIRTFLSFSLVLEITGRWPWQKSHPATPTQPSTPAARDGSRGRTRWVQPSAGTARCIVMQIR
ncbi:MAG: DUF1622 domain-containing protein [Mycobacteriaceae bacterium]